MKKNHFSPLLTAGLSVLALSPTGHAQSPAAITTDEAASDKGGYAIEEIVVTARRTKENIQEVPLSITALSSDDLSRESITTAQDLMGKVGSMTIGANGAMRNSEAPNLRGQGATFGAGPGVAMYWAEVPLPLDVFRSGKHAGAERPTGHPVRPQHDGRRTGAGTSQAKGRFFCTYSS